MEVGKLPPNALKRLLARAKPGEGVIVGPGYGEDAAAVEFGGTVLVAAADPITFATDRIGYYAVSVNANDVAVVGAEPKFFLATILLPDGSSEADADLVFEQIEAACEEINVALIGGHTEVTRSVTQVVVSGCMLGEIDRHRLITSHGARVGDAVVLAGGIAIEGASILAREAADDLKAAGVDAGVIDCAKSYLDDPGICILDYARAAVNQGGVTAMHDPTEGGLATALRELADASGCGLEIHRDRIHVWDDCAVICAALSIDPLGLIASGSLLITCEPHRAVMIVRALAMEGVLADVIGRVVEPGCGVRFADGSPLPSFERDEIARFFEAKRG